MNIFEQLVERHPEIKWPMISLSRNPSISIEFVKRHPDWKWCWFNISFLKATPSIVEANPDLPWDITGLTSNRSMMKEFVEKHNDWKWDYHHLSYSMHIDEISKFTDLREWISLSRNPSLTSDFVLHHPEIKWHVVSISENAPLDTIADLINAGWKIPSLERSYNPNITVEYIKAHPELKWDCEYLSYTRHITPEYVYSNPGPWHVPSLARSPNFSYKCICDITDNIEDMACSYYLSIEDAEKMLPMNGYHFLLSHLASNPFYGAIAKHEKQLAHVKREVMLEAFRRANKGNKLVNSGDDIVRYMSFI